MQHPVICPHCGQSYSCYRNPTPTADVIIYDQKQGIVIIKRQNKPLGYALPGGFVEEGETAETCAKREMLEETGLEVELLGLLGVYSHPKRDPRQHTLTCVFVGTPKDSLKLSAGDDAAEAKFYPLDHLPSPLVFDHEKILAHFKDDLEGRRSLASLGEEG